MHTHRPCYPLAIVLYYRRNLPHGHPEGASLFLTWRLHGSLPASFFAGPREAESLSPGDKFRRVDEVLDRGDTGPVWLKNPRIAATIVEKLARKDILVRDRSNDFAGQGYVRITLGTRAQTRRLAAELGRML